MIEHDNEMMIVEGKLYQTREELFTSLYLKTFPAVARYVSSMGGDQDEARDAFQEALLVYYEKVIIDQSNPMSNHKAYLFGIAKNKWLKHREKAQKTVSLDGDIYLEEPVQEPVKEKIALFLEQAGQKCMKILESFYYEKLSITQLKSRFGFRSERSATVQKYKCLEKVRNEIKEKSLAYADFIN